MAKPKNRIPLGDTSGANFNNPFASLSSVQSSKQGPALEERREPETTAPKLKSGKISVHAERKGRGGKTVTLVRGLGLAGSALDAVAKEMRQALGCGASVEDDAIVLQGDQVERARDYLKKSQRA